jgi:hypothetical protein
MVINKPGGYPIRWVFFARNFGPAISPPATAIIPPWDAAVVIYTLIGVTPMLILSRRSNFDNYREAESMRRVTSSAY